MLWAACASNGWLTEFGKRPIRMTPATSTIGDMSMPKGASFGRTGKSIFASIRRPKTPKNKYIEYTNVKMLPSTAKYGMIAVKKAVADETDSKLNVDSKNISLL